MSVFKQDWILILYEKELSSNEKLILSGDEFHYLKNVLRLQKNDSILISNGVGIRASGILAEFRKNACEILITDVEHVPPPKRKVHLVLAHLKPAALEEALFTASELGVHAVHLFRSERTVSKQPLKIEKLQKISNEAMRISKSAYSANIFQYNNLDECLHSLQTQLHTTCFLFCDENASSPILKFHFDDRFEEICVIIGPEASFSLQERTKILQLKNCFAVSLGEKILRAPTAVTCACFISVSAVGNDSIPQA